MTRCVLLGGVARAIACCWLLACSAYDPLLPAAPPLLDAGPTVPSDGGAAVADSGAGGAGGGAAQDAAAVPGCRPNPVASDPLCPEICTELCNGLDDDCDGRADEDASAGCTADHATATCAEDTCVIVECEGPFRDCDARADNGCEVSTADDPAHCGGCDQACTVERATAMACSDGTTCIATECTEGYGDCDRQPTHGGSCQGGSPGGGGGYGRRRVSAAISCDGCN